MYRKVQKNSVLKKIFFLFLSFCPFIPGFSEEFQVKEPVLTVKSSVQWEKGFFLSETSMNIKAAGLTMPSARGTGVERINMELPLLVKEALFTLPVDSSNTLEDAVAQQVGVHPQGAVQPDLPLRQSAGVVHGDIVPDIGIDGGIEHPLFPLSALS